ncbi:uncharacterized protein LOC132942565 [Metopolophium dirhodum]|uniref:uncharacterized protein LOC132942565 n=1 Tax=Metopolophium dirhodum TaxID=44670 RepID=UPI0029902076|nr:uncharacterized protein LOC132942565 [Metopolophium dirhodum]
MRRYRLPYWAFVPTLGVWPGVAGTGSGTGSAVAAAATIPPPPRGSVAVNLDSGRVTVVDDVAGRPEVGDAAADPNRKWRPAQVKPLHSNTPSVGGPSWLRKTAVAAAASDPVVQASQVKNSTAVATERPVTKIYLKPSARAKAGAGGVALSNPISTAVVRRGDTVSIEYLPDATAEAGEGGVAISRPELVIHFID